MSALPTFTIFDVETTGLDPNKGHRIIELAGVKVVGGQINEAETFDQLINPERDIPMAARQVNKIKPEEVAVAPTIDKVLPDFLDFAKGTVLVAHNAAFDLGFLENEKQCCWGYVELPETICTLRLSRALYPQEFRHNLDAVGKRFGIEYNAGHLHRALPDVILTAKVFLQMINDNQISTLDQLRAKAGARQLV